MSGLRGFISMVVLLLMSVVYFVGKVNGIELFSLTFPVQCACLAIQISTFGG